VSVFRPHTPVREPGFCEAQLATLLSLVRLLAESERVREGALWFYTPMALPLADAFTPALVVYDRMDALAEFAFAPPEMREREAELLERADLVFTGGSSLYRSVQDRHDNVHCFPSSVEAEHFAQALDEPEEPLDQAHLPHPRLGYVGVIDERMDLDLLRALASARPDWQIVMVGPVVKIDPATLPRASNLHYLGQKDYAELPAYLSGWDVALLPFARNEATRFISPTKTLEYFATETPTVSTPIPDVAVAYGDVVYLGANPDAFVAACEAALSAGPAERAVKAARMRAVLAQTSWDRTAAAMEGLMEDALETKAARAVPIASQAA
jgi:glycosyltransferase involved in cell wall biosynthesis